MTKHLSSGLSVLAAAYRPWALQRSPRLPKPRAPSPMTSGSSRFRRRADRDRRLLDAHRPGHGARSRPEAGRGDRLRRDRERAHRPSDPVHRRRQPMQCRRRPGGSDQARVDPEHRGGDGARLLELGHPGAPILWNAGIVSVGTSTTAPSLTAADRKPDYFGYLRTVYSDADAGQFDGRYFYEDLQCRTLATIHDGSPYAAQLAKTVADTFRELGGEVVAEEAVAPTDVDMRPVLTGIAAKEPCLLYYPIFVAAAAQITRQAPDIRASRTPRSWAAARCWRRASSRRRATQRSASSSPTWTSPLRPWARSTRRSSRLTGEVRRGADPGVSRQRLRWRADPDRRDRERRRDGWRRDYLHRPQGVARTRSLRRRATRASAADRVRRARPVRRLQVRRLPLHRCRSDDLQDRHQPREDLPK